MNTFAGNEDKQSNCMDSILSEIALQNSRLKRMSKYLDNFIHLPTPKTSIRNLYLQAELYRREYCDFQATNEQLCIKVEPKNQIKLTYFTNGIQDQYLDIYHKLNLEVDLAVQRISRNHSHQS